MRSILLFSVLCLSFPAFAQVQAGQEAEGQSIIEIGYYFEGNEPFTSDTASIDLNCDGIIDLNISLEIGYPAVDGPHFISFECVHPDLSVAFFDDSEYVILWETILFNEGDVIDDSDPDIWGVNWGIAASLGGWSDNGDPLVENQYWGYRLADNFGWIDISYDLTSNILSIDIPRYLSTCVPDNVPEEELNLTIGPNPVTNGEVFIHGATNLAHVELWSVAGKLIQSWDSPEGHLVLEAHPGTYGLVLTDGSGRSKSFSVIVLD